MTSRARFKSRTSDNIAILLAAFILVEFILSGLVAIIFTSFLPMFVVDAVGIGAAYYFYILWDKRAIRLQCRACKNIVLSNTPWVCGFCKESSKNANEHPFVDKCMHCGNEPKAYKCHHGDCRKFIFLTDDRLETNYAYCLIAPSEVPEPPKPDERTVKVKAHQETKQDKEHELEVAKLDEQLKQIKERIDGPKIKTPFEQKKDSFDKYYDGVMGVREYACQKRAEAAERYKDNPELLKDANEAIDEFIRRSA